MAWVWLGCLCLRLHVRVAKGDASVTLIDVTVARFQGAVTPFENSLEIACKTTGVHMLEAGSQCPDFSLRSHEGEEITQEYLNGKWTVLHTFPLAFTGG